MSADLIIRSKAPFAAARHTEFRALERVIGSLDEIYDGGKGIVRGSFVPNQPMSQSVADETRIDSAFYGPLQWKELFKSMSIAGRQKVGDEQCLVLQQTPQKGPPIKSYVSTKSWRVVRRDLTKTPEAGASATVSEEYSDFRTVDGVVIPFLIKQKIQLQGEQRLTITIKQVKFDQDLPDELFRVP